MKDIAGLLEKATKDLGLDSVILYGSKEESVSIVCHAAPDDFWHFLTSLFAQDPEYLDLVKDIIKEYENQ